MDFGEACRLACDNDCRVGVNVWDPRRESWTKTMILEILSWGPRSLSDLACGMEASTKEHYRWGYVKLMELVKAGLVKYETVGNRRFYMLEGEEWAGPTQEMLQAAKQAARRNTRAAWHRSQQAKKR